jgi:hypothetical protein
MAGLVVNTKYSCGNMSSGSVSVSLASKPVAASATSRSSITIFETSKIFCERL